jgi:hypothetical protein
VTYYLAFWGNSTNSNEFCLLQKKEIIRIMAGIQRSCVEICSREFASDKGTWLIAALEFNASFAIWLTGQNIR